MYITLQTSHDAYPNRIREGRGEQQSVHRSESSHQITIFFTTTIDQFK